MRIPRLTIRRLMVAVAIAGLGLGAFLWWGRLRRSSAYYKFVAGAYELESRNHGIYGRFYGEIIEGRPRETLRSTGYANITLFTNNYDGRLTIPRQDECDPHALISRNPDEGRDLARLAAFEARERLRAVYFSGLAAKYRHAASYPWLPIAPDPAPPE